MEDLKSTGISVLFFLMIAVFACASADAVQVEMSSSLNPVGSGARATGMGGAFISVADDATAASWNPAGLVQLEKPELSAVHQYFKRKQKYDSESHPEINGTNSMDAGALNYASAAYPFVLFDRNIIVSVNYQRLFELNKKVDFDYTWDILGDKLFDEIEFTQDGFLYALSPAFAVQVTPQFYLGATLNLWDDYVGDNGWETTQKSFGTGVLAGYPVEMRSSSRQTVEFSGVNAHFGFLWSLHPKFTLGGVIKTPFDADIRRERKFHQSQNWTTLDDFSESLSVTKEDLTMKMPMSYGLGISYRHSDTLTVAFDVYRTDWSEYVLEDEDGNETNPLDGRPLKEGSLKDTTQLRMGAEYLFIREKYVIPVRCGLFYDPEPAKESLDDFYGISVGTGYVRGRVALDMAYQYRSGKDVSGDLPAVKDNSVDIRQHLLMTSVIFYF